MVGQPSLPGAIIEHLSANVIEVRIIDADDRPDIGQEALTVVDTAMGGHSGEVSDNLECYKYQMVLNTWAFLI